MSLKAYLILRSARRARLEGRKAVLQPFISNSCPVSHGFTPPVRHDGPLERPPKWPSPKNPVIAQPGSHPTLSARSTGWFGPRARCCPRSAEPTPEELAERLGVPVEKVQKILAIANRPIRLERPLGEDP